VIFKKPVNPAMLKNILLQQCRPEQISQTHASHSSTAVLAKDSKAQ
jgi:hypothetical protein